MEKTIQGGTPPRQLHRICSRNIEVSERRGYGIRLKNFCFFVLLFGLMSIAEISGAQEVITIERAGSLDAATIDGQTVRKLLNDVRISTDRMTLESDSIYQYLGRHLLHAWNVQIETEKEMIWADTLYHNTQTDFSEFRGKVIILSEENILFSDAVDIFHPLDLAVFNVPVRFEDDQGTLIAESGFYDRRIDNAFFRGNVQLADSTQYLEADSLFMNRTYDFYELFSRVYANDYEEKVTFSGDYLVADSTGHRLLYGDAWMMQEKETEADTTQGSDAGMDFQQTDIDAEADTTDRSDNHMMEFQEIDTDTSGISDSTGELSIPEAITDTSHHTSVDPDRLLLLEEMSTDTTHSLHEAMEPREAKIDTTHLLAEIIEIQKVDTVSYMDAYQNVRIWSTRFSAVADTAHYRDDLDQFILKSSPKLWQKNIQLTGPTIEAYMEDEEIRFLTSYPRPIAVQEDTLTGRLHQLAGDTLHAFFDEGAIQRLVVFDNSEIIFHVRDENEEPDGMVELMASGPSTMYFLDGEFDFFKADQNPAGSHLPENPANVERKLNNFSWDPELRPEKPSIRTPRLPEIPEDRPFEFPIRYTRYLESLPEVLDAEMEEPEEETDPGNE